MSVLKTKEEDTINLELYSRGVKDVNYYIYRAYTRRGRIRRKYIKLTTSVGVILINDIKARRQFLNHLSLGLLETERIWDAEERNETVMEAVEQRAFDELAGKKLPLVYRCHLQQDGTYDAWSIVTTDYVEVPTKEAIEYFENILQTKGFGDSMLKKQWDDGKAVYNVYELMQSPTEPVKVGDLASCGVVLRAGYSGDRSVGLSSYWTILACTNGMMSNRQVMAYRGIHRGISKEEILSQVEHAFEVVLSEHPMLEGMIEKAQEPIDEEEEKELLDRILGNYPEHIKKAIKKALKEKYAEAQGPFRVSQALSDTATHYEHATDNYRNELQKDAFRVLTIAKRKKKREQDK